MRKIAQYYACAVWVRCARNTCFLTWPVVNIAVNKTTIDQLDVAFRVGASQLLRSVIYLWRHYQSIVTS